MPRVVTGIKPTGRPHLGNYLGMIRPGLEAASAGNALFFIADYHALTTTRSAAQLRAGVFDLAATLIAFGLEPGRTVLYRQSDLPEVCELAWILACVASKGLLNRAHAYKSAAQRNIALGRDPDSGVSTGLFSYPVLMAADILIHRAEAVPVGRDQRQHVEMAREMARSFNRSYGPVLLVPEAIVDERVMTIPGLDGRKMSKSYGNQLALAATPSQIRSRVARIVTDSRSPSERKEPDTILALYRAVASAAETAELERRYREGGTGYAEAKALLAEAVDALVGPARTRHAELMSDPGALADILADGARRARASAAPTLAAVRSATGLSYD